MKPLSKLGPLAACLTIVFLAAPVHAASNVSSVDLFDLNQNATIERAVITVANPDKKAWVIHDSSKLKAYYNGTALKVNYVYLASDAAADPVKIEVVWDESDSNLPLTTSSSGFGLEYVQSGLGKGIDDGAAELSAIAKTDAVKDAAPPMLISSDPVMGLIGAAVNQPITLNFSEPLDQSVFAFSSTPDAAWWNTQWQSASTVRLTHPGFPTDRSYNFSVTGAQDKSGNPLAYSGYYPNPFTFRTYSTTSDNPQSYVDNAFAFLRPSLSDQLVAGQAFVIAWYSTEASVASYKLSYAVGAGLYRDIATIQAPASQYVWYPPSVSGSVFFKLEGLNAAGATVAFAAVSPITVVTPSVHAPIKALSETTLDAVGETAAAASVLLDAKPQSAELWCNGQKTAATVGISGYRPVKVTVSLALSKGLSYACRFALKDSFGGEQDLDLPAFTAAAVQPAPQPPAPSIPGVTEGSLIKGSSAAVYWYQSGKRNVFPNPDVYFSWFKDFSGVVTITDSQLASIPLGKNVKMKGGVYLVKIQSDPKTYAVEPDGTLRWVQTEAQAIALYGANWNKRVKDVDVGLFVDYKTGAPLASGEQPAGYAG